MGPSCPVSRRPATARIFATNVWDKVRSIFEIYLAGAPIYTVSSPADLKSDELRPTIDRYFRGTGIEAEERIKLFKLIWDALYSELQGARRCMSATLRAIRNNNVSTHSVGQSYVATPTGTASSSDDCMADYDLDGWTKPLTHPGDFLRWRRRRRCVHQLRTPGPETSTAANPQSRLRYKRFRAGEVVAARSGSSGLK